jgi:signal transduction histidine kinase
MAIRNSVFAKLVTIMIVMALLLMFLVSAFFVQIVTPSLNGPFQQMRNEYARLLAATSPGLDSARRMAARLDVDLRYEGPDGAWSTYEELPTIAEVRDGGLRHSRHFLPRRDYQLVPAPSGGTYLLAWKVGNRMVEAHLVLFAMLLIVMALVIVTAHLTLRALLRPLRALNDAVTHLGAGQLDVRIPGGTGDEFGRLSDAFNLMVGRVRGMIHARDQLLVDVSHELRSPITRMKVALELLPNHEQRARLAGDVAEMEHMVTELLELERLQARHGVAPVRQDLMPILREVAGKMSDRPPGVCVVSAAEQVVLDVDGDKVRTVLRNLLENAIKYSLADSRPVELSVARTAAGVVVRVTDDGVGIPESAVERVFEPFYRVDPSRSKGTGGYGLGLSICKRVMEAHGGAIAVERGAGRGTSFVLTFPA